MNLSNFGFRFPYFERSIVTLKSVDPQLCHGSIEEGGEVPPINKDLRNYNPHTYVPGSTVGLETRSQSPRPITRRWRKGRTPNQNPLLFLPLSLTPFSLFHSLSFPSPSLHPLPSSFFLLSPSLLLLLFPLGL